MCTYQAWIDGCEIFEKRYFRQTNFPLVFFWKFSKSFVLFLFLLKVGFLWLREQLSSLLSRRYIFLLDWCSFESWPFFFPFISSLSDSGSCFVNWMSLLVVVELAVCNSETPCWSLTVTTIRGSYDHIDKYVVQTCTLVLMSPCGVQGRNTCPPLTHWYPCDTIELSPYSERYSLLQIGNINMRSAHGMLIYLHVTRTRYMTTLDYMILDRSIKAKFYILIISILRYYIF